MSSRPRRLSFLRIHAGFVITPPPLRNLYFYLGHPAGVFSEAVEQDDEISRTPIQDPVKLSPVVTPKFPKLAFDLRAVREGEVRVRRIEQVKAGDLVVERNLALHVQTLDKVVNGLRPI
jgi:hypothetical protein